MLSQQAHFTATGQLLAAEFRNSSGENVRADKRPPHSVNAAAARSRRAAFFSGVCFRRPVNLPVISRPTIVSRPFRLCLCVCMVQCGGVLGAPSCV